MIQIKRMLKAKKKKGQEPKKDKNQKRTRNKKGQEAKRTKTYLSIQEPKNICQRWQVGF